MACIINDARLGGRFNHRRFLESSGNIPPAEADERYDACWSKQLWQRNLDQTTSGKPGAVQFRANYDPVMLERYSAQTASTFQRL
ncbi:hypothetical protein ATO67_20590 [Agrobacterium bohemicum]|uniref:Uncharacterized protein n=1 Tax=Agrobacterium bohemicum TaxID=2052828 RepID=A0A135P6U8_9HYPH|nr:hypothetical protein ATO67_20590 [Agrobacterium bohemicum]